jgi:hypothetical protein
VFSNSILRFLKHLDEVIGGHVDTFIKLKAHCLSQFIHFGNVSDTPRRVITSQTSIEGDI